MLISIGVKNLRWAILIVGALGLSLSVYVHAQVAAGTLTGTISDTSGAVIPNAQVSIKDLATSIVRNVTSDTAGLYTAPNLLPGTYEITVTAQGFATAVRSGITLTVGQQQLLNITMAVGQVTQRVEVTGEAPAIELASSTITGAVSANTIRELPLNARDWTLLATLQPGVSSSAPIQMPTNTGATERIQRGLGTQLTISGSRPQANNYRIDGITANDYSNGSPGSVIGTSLGVDAIQEFSVLTSNYTAEYGRTSGGVINAVTRTGTNQFHGDAFEFLRNSALDAPNFFDNFANKPKPPFRRNDFGAAAGGPIIKDRTFFFGDYEGVRQNLGVSGVATVPSVDARNGILHNPNGTTTIVVVSPSVAPFLALWHVPNAGTSGNTGVYAFSAPQLASENFGTGRIDHKFSEKDSLDGSFQIDRSILHIPDKLDTINRTNTQGRDFVTLQESHVFTTQLINTVRVGYNRVVVSGGVVETALVPQAADPSLAAAPGQNAPDIKVSGITEFPGGVHAHSVTFNTWNDIQAYDDAFLTKGIHSLKFGFAVERIDYNAFSSGSQGGKFQFGSLVNFLTNQPKTFEIEGFTPSLRTPRGYRQSVFGAYIQDDIRLRPNLTFNLGLRYEPTSTISEVQGKLASFVNVYTDTAPRTGNPMFPNPTRRNFEPRLGFAWDPFKTGKTSVRGGFGIFDVLPLTYTVSLPQVSAFPFFNDGSSSSLPVGSFPSGAFSLVQADNQSRTSYIQQNPKRSYLMSWNLSVERELVHNLTGMVAYVGSHGVHQLFAEDDMNIVLPTQTSAGYLWPFPAGSGTRLNPNIGRIDTRQWSSSTTYSGLQTSLSERLSHGLQVKGSFTWSKAIDDGSAALVGDPFANSISSLYFFDPNVRRGLSDFNVDRALVVNATWLVPTGHLQGPASWVLGGWELGGIVTAQDGTPFPVLIGGDPLGLNNQDAFAYPDRLSGSACSKPVFPGNVNYVNLSCFAVPMATTAIAAQCTPFSAVPGSCSNLLGNVGRNSVIGPGLVDVDFSLIKNTYVRRISEAFNVQFRAEFFNVLNRTNFNSPIDNDVLFDDTGAPVGGAGVIDQTATTSRQIQLALKVIW